MEQKKRNLLMCFVTLVLVFGLSGSAFAADIYWDGGGSDNRWDTPENWVGDVVPIDNNPLTGDKAIFDDSSVQQPLVCDGVTASVRGFKLSNGSGTSPCVLTVTGGSLTFTGDKMELGTGNGGEGILNMSGGSALASDGIIVGNWQAVGATFNMSGGTFTSQVLTSPGTGWWDQFVVGNEVPGTLNMSGGAIIATGDMILSRANGSSTVNMTGGTIDISGTIHASYGNKKPVDFNLGGGVVTAGELVMKSRGKLDLTEGVMILDGNVEGDINAYITAGLITGYDGTGTVSAVFDAISDTTTLSAIPEPATMMLLSLGSLALLRRRRA